MDIKVNQVEQTVQTQQQSNVQQTDDTFRFMLASNIEISAWMYRICDGI